MYSIKCMTFNISCNLILSLTYFPVIQDVFFAHFRAICMAKFTILTRLLRNLQRQALWEIFPQQAVQETSQNIPSRKTFYNWHIYLETFYNKLSRNHTGSKASFIPPLCQTYRFWHSSRLVEVLAPAKGWLASLAKDTTQTRCFTIIFKKLKNVRCLILFEFLDFLINQIEIQPKQEIPCVYIIINFWQSFSLFH